MLSSQLLIAYCETDYKIPSQNLVLRLGEHNPELDMLLEKYEVEDWCFITAWNPKSNLLSTKENIELNRRLERDIKKFVYFQGKGEGKLNSKWPQEESYLVLGIPFESAKELGEKYKQNAMIVGRIRGVPELLVLV